MPQPDTVERGSARPDALGRVLVIAAVVFAAAASVALLFVPTATSETVSEGIVQSDPESLVDSQGWGVAAILAVPVLISAVPLLLPAAYRLWVTLGSATLLTGGVLVGAASIGGFYLPAAAAMVAAAVRMAIAARPARADATSGRLSGAAGDEAP